MVYLIIYFALFAIWITAELLLAPKGFEDKNGFHYGNPKEDKFKIYKSKKEQNNIKILTEKKSKISLQI